VYCDSWSEDDGGVIIVFIFAVFGVGVVFVLLVGLVVLVDDVGGSWSCYLCSWIWRHVCCDAALSCLVF